MKSDAFEFLRSYFCGEPISALKAKTSLAVPQTCRHHANRIHTSGQLLAQSPGIVVNAPAAAAAAAGPCVVNWRNLAPNNNHRQFSASRRSVGGIDQ